MIRVPSPLPDRAAFPAALADYAPVLTRLHRLAAKTAWLIDAAGLHTEAARHTVAWLATAATDLGTLRELDSPEAATVIAGLRDRLVPLGAFANALRCIVLDPQLNNRLAEIACAVAYVDQALSERLASRPAGAGIAFPVGATVAAWRKRFPNWALIADGWIMRTA